MKSFTAALAFRYPLGFRTIQVRPKSAARKYAQGLALSIGHISRLWKQKAFCRSVDERARSSFAPQRRCCHD